MENLPNLTLILPLLLFCFFSPALAMVPPPLTPPPFTPPPFTPPPFTPPPFAPPLTFPNPRLADAYKALQAWKSAMTSDPTDFTGNWVGPNVCAYNGIFCCPAPDNSYIQTVVGVDLNGANIAGSLVPELGLLTDLAIFHLNSNRFCHTIPSTIKNWRYVYELDLSNNLFETTFPSCVLSMPSLTYLDLRFNSFHGPLPSKLFDMKLEALFVNDNKFSSKFPQNIGNLPAFVVVLANNDLAGCIPPSIAKMAPTLEEINLMNIGLRGCLPSEIGQLTQLIVFDVSKNALTGPLPNTMGNLRNLEQLNVAENKLAGNIPPGICNLPKLENFTFSSNFFTGEPGKCLALKSKDDKLNCIPNRPSQRPPNQCKPFTGYNAGYGYCNNHGVC